MALPIDPAGIVDSAFEYPPLAIVVAAVVWVALRELGPIGRLHRRLQ